MKGLIDRIKAWPRAVQWAALAGVILAAYFLVVEPGIDRYLSLSRTANEAQAKLADFSADGAAREQQRQSIDLGLRQFGRVEFPGDERSRSEALARAIEQILSKHDVRERTQTTRRAPLGVGPLDRAVGVDNRVDRLIVELSFDASPEQVAAVLADLEQSPVVACVSRVQIRKAPEGDRSRPAGRTVRATLSVEAWLLARRERTR